ncbi:hypothetical protein [Ignavibacterium sp.]|uniref:hypothetical protein n=1 Tax=Ignavibacterium sp. TaxID=2651167 RepID=UPI002200149F|nr:hypothetical protein [Ignavibacterium sp.]BDQ03342.1 MAG: hypothetical protein KatS3mg037_1917 [Ignavibacterium sp.]
MNPEEIQKKYFIPGSKGYKVLSFYFNRYRDLFVKTIYSELDEFINQVYLNICSISLSDEIKNPDAYLIAAIKIQCRVQLDLALKIKKKQQNEIPIEYESDDEDMSSLYFSQKEKQKTYSKVESEELFSIINLFKLSLKEQERALFNLLVNDMHRTEIARITKKNLNTIDTQIRRLRIKFFSYLKKNGYNFPMFNKFDIQ